MNARLPCRGTCWIGPGGNRVQRSRSLPSGLPTSSTLAPSLPPPSPPRHVLVVPRAFCCDFRGREVRQSAAGCAYPIYSIRVQSNRIERRTYSPDPPLDIYSPDPTLPSHNPPPGLRSVAILFDATIPIASRLPASLDAPLALRTTACARHHKVRVSFYSCAYSLS